MCNSNTSINAEAIAKEIANALTEISDSVVDHLSDTFDGERDHVIEFVDGTPVPFCPMTRRQCMGRLCAAARREDCTKLATLNTGHVAEWKCAQYQSVVDWDEQTYDWDDGDETVDCSSVLTPTIPPVRPSSAEPLCLDYLLEEGDENLAKRVYRGLTSIEDTLEEAMDNAGEVREGTLASYLLSAIENAYGMAAILKADTMRKKESAK